MVQDGSDTLVWGAEQIGEVIGRPVRAAFHLLEQGLLPAKKKIGGRWVASRRKLLEAVIGETAVVPTTTHQPNAAALHEGVRPLPPASGRANEHLVAMSAAKELPLPSHPDHWHARSPPPRRRRRARPTRSGLKNEAPMPRVRKHGIGD